MCFNFKPFKLLTVLQLYPLLDKSQEVAITGSIKFQLGKKGQMKRKTLFIVVFYLKKSICRNLSSFFFTSRTSFSFCVLIKLPYNATETGPLLKCISKVKQFCFSLITDMIAMKIRKHQGLFQL